MAASILVVGSLNTDLTIRLPRIPRPGETVIGGEFSTAQGGKGANQAVAAARAGGKVEFIARVGRDAFGDRALEILRRDGVGIKHVVRDPGAPTGAAFIFVGRRGENSIGVASGANMALSPADIERAAPAFARAAILLLQLEIPLPTVVKAAEVAAERGTKIVLNPAPARPLPKELRSLVTILTPNRQEAEFLTGLRIASRVGLAKAARLLRVNQSQAVIITRGEAGLFAVGPDFEQDLPAYEVRAVDTTAAGDIFNGSLAAALTQGRPLPEAIRFAAAAAALSVTRQGAQPSAPYRDEIESFLRERRTRF